MINANLCRSLALLASCGILAPAQSPQPIGSYDFDVTGDTPFTDTKLDVKAGEVLKFKATGNLILPRLDRQIGPEGIGRGWADMVRAYPVVDGAKAALIGRIGDRETARAFSIGSAQDHTVGLDGRLFLGVNMLSQERYDGVFHVHVERFAPADGPARNGGSDSFDKLPKLTQEQLDSVPPRVSDKDGNLGDRVNFLVIGAENQVKVALEQGGWITVDTSVKQAIFEGLLNSFSKQAYVSLPMSSLMLFGRVQDFGYAQGDPLRIVASRHHFRLWRSPITVGGRTVWAGAGTHDIGFDRDHRNHGITHRIDPDTDKEREYIVASLKESGLVAGVVYMTSRNAVTDARTATGSGFHSDGRTAVIYLIPDTGDPALKATTRGAGR